MLDFVRNNTKLLMGLLFLLIIPSFVLFGIDGYNRSSAGANKVATVDGKSITQVDWDNAHRLVVDRLSAKDPNADLKLLDSAEVRYSTLEQLVRERVQAAAAARDHLTIPDAVLAQALARDPAIATMRKKDGSIDVDAYRQFAAQQGLTPAQLEARVRADLSARQVLRGVINSVLASNTQADLALGKLTEQREIQVFDFSATAYARKLNPTDADLKTFYEANKNRFQAPEEADVQYIVLDLEHVKKSVTVNEQDLKTYYEQNAQTLGTPEKRRISHILLAAAKDAPQTERDAAKARAQTLLAQLRGAPDTFAQVAQKESQDDPSASSGGDLGLFGKGDKGLDPVILDAAFALGKTGDISDVVESEFGYHIIQLTQLQSAQVPPYETLKTQLEDTLRTQQAQRKFSELADEFKNGVYEVPDTLQTTADKLGLKIESAQGVGRTPTAGASGPLANARFLAALFEPNAIEKKNNTDAIEIAPSVLAAGRISQHKPAQPRPFEEVQMEVAAAYLAEKGAEAARKEGEAKLAAWKAQPDLASSGGGDGTPPPATITVSRSEEPRKQPPELIEAVMRVDSTKLPQFVGVSLGQSGYAIAKVSKVLESTPKTEEEISQQRLQYEQLWAMAEAQAYTEWLKKRFNAQILVPKPANLAVLRQ
ncbi:MAG: SurA N-terminal domain-containing protein [Burkholderiaceae bacterium]|jgi:peptidyl-prolyl cis-trans isomerase D|nr:SurA N-terminal domain-containing protein [Burkholderiaceae bacterium]